MKKPEPKPTAIVCSLCGLPWDKHGDKPIAETCIELLKAELSRRPPRFMNTTISGPTGYGVTFQ